MYMLIFGLTGPIRHGKSTFANAVASYEPKTVHFESSDIIAEVIDDWHQSLGGNLPESSLESVDEWLAKLPPILSRRVNIEVSPDKLKIDPNNYRAHPIEYNKLFLHIDNLHRSPELAQQKITEVNKELYRPILQWLGGYLVHKIDRGIWYNEIARRVKQAEADGFKVCLVGGLRYPNDAHVLQEMGGKIIKIYRPGFLANDILDPTERERESIPVDSVIISNGGVEDVGRTAKRILSDTYSGDLKHEYIATDS